MGFHWTDSFVFVLFLFLETTSRENGNKIIPYRAYYFSSSCCINLGKKTSTQYSRKVACFTRLCFSISGKGYLLGGRVTMVISRVERLTSQMWCNLPLVQPFSQRDKLPVPTKCFPCCFQRYRETLSE